MFGSSMGAMTVEQCGEHWFVLEDGRRIGGVVRYPFESREAAQRYLDREIADERETMAEGDVGCSARCRVIRETDPEVWAKVMEIEKQFADDDNARDAAHYAADTWVVMVKIAVASLEAEGKIERCEINGKPAHELAAGKN
jgi:hypothetical protein